MTFVLGASVGLASVAGQAADVGLDACTLNNALNVAQLVVLVALLRWVRTDRGDASR